ncbi:MAG: hypothetical protein ACFBSE_15920 [Prochloraceae cyanobacterium]
MFNILFKNRPVKNKTAKQETFFLNSNEAKSIGGDKPNKKTEAKATVKNRRKTNKNEVKFVGKNQRKTDKTNKRIKSFFGRKAKAKAAQNDNAVNLDTQVEIQESWVDTDMDKFREMARGLIESRPTKLM